VKDLYLIRGLPGAGKTTFAKSVKQEGDTVVAADDFMVNAKGDYTFDGARLREVHEKCREVVSKAMQGGVARIFVHNTFTTGSELEPYCVLAQQHNYRVFSVIVENRHGGVSLAQPPFETIRNMRDRFQIQL
jgi:predicted kinase